MALRFFGCRLFGIAEILSYDLHQRLFKVVEARRIELKPLTCANVVHARLLRDAVEVVSKRLNIRAKITIDSSRNVSMTENPRQRFDAAASV